MVGKILILLSLALVVGVPFLLRPEPEGSRDYTVELVIITPHNEYIREEFARGFREWYQEKTGEIVRIDWRMPGGTSEISRYLGSEYQAAFRSYWTRQRGEDWNRLVQGAFDRRNFYPAENPADDTLEQRARRAFLESEVGIGIDLFFGGGSYDFTIQAEAGRLVSGGVEERNPEWFTDDILPAFVSGETFRDAEGRWYGAALSSFGLIYNTDSLARLGVVDPPRQWLDLADPIFRGEIALADPTKSGSIAKAFEMVIQQQMQDLVRQSGRDPFAMDLANEEDFALLAEGWMRGLQLVQLMGANARYFTDAATKPLIDVSLGDAAAGMAIDFYGRTQQETLVMRGSDRFHYYTPPGGSTISVDPIGLLRGAPNPEIARAFIDYVLSPEGQRLWNLRPGTPGGPRDYALRRLPVRKDFYQEDNIAYRSDPEEFPYDTADAFFYHADWTGGLFSEMRFIIRVMCLDAHDELRRAWREIIAAGMPEEALAVLQDLSVLSYGEARGRIREKVRSRDPLDEVRLARDLGNHFRAQYREAARLAREAR